MEILDPDFILKVAKHKVFMPKCVDEAYFDLVNTLYKWGVIPEELEPEVECRILFYLFR